MQSQSQINISCPEHTNGTVRKGTNIPLSCREKKETILNEKAGEKKRKAHIYNLAAISCLTSLLFICVNSPCSPVSLKCSVPLYTLGNAPDHWPCFGLLEVLLKADSFFSSLFEDWLFIMTPWILNENQNPLLSPFKLRSHRSLTGTSKHWIKQSCQQLGTIINFSCVVSSWVLGLEFYLFKASVNIHCFPQAAPFFLGILDPKTQDPEINLFLLVESV